MINQDNIYCLFHRNSTDLHTQILVKGFIKGVHKAQEQSRNLFLCTKYCIGYNCIIAQEYQGLCSGNVITEETITATSIY